MLKFFIRAFTATSLVLASVPVFAEAGHGVWHPTCYDMGPAQGTVCH
jgi:hypothetical protein